YMLNQSTNVSSPIIYQNPQNIRFAGPDPSPAIVRGVAQQQQGQIRRVLGQVESINAQSAEFNAVLAQVLQGATGNDLSDDPSRWWSWWAEENEQYEPPQNPLAVSSNSVRNQTLSFPRMVSCFVAGTPVWTISGPMQIENIKVGELVLAQDSETG